MYRIFKKESVIILTGDRRNFKGQKILSWSKDALHDFLTDTREGINQQLVFYGDDLETLWRTFKKEFQVIEAAGGMVRNESGETLFIFRHDKWDLPKGKIDPGESNEEAAIREVKEECGFQSIRIGNKLPTTYHIYKENGQEILKITYWFGMKSDERSLRPQLEEGITDLRWVGDDEFEQVLSNTYPNIALLAGSV